MEIRIGIVDVPREVSITSEETSETIIAALKAARENGGTLELTDPKGRRLVVPADRIGYLDLGAPDSRPVGFGAV